MRQRKRQQRCDSNSELHAKFSRTRFLTQRRLESKLLWKRNAALIIAKLLPKYFIGMQLLHAPVQRSKHCSHPNYSTKPHKTCDQMSSHNFILQVHLSCVLLFWQQALNQEGSQSLQMRHL
eukprot:4698887-Amphidinium_carterae.1